MSLYPILPITPSFEPNPEPIVVPSSNLMIAPIDMTVTAMMQIKLQQLASTQDYSLRIWLSLFPNGVAIAPGNFPLLRSAMLPIIVHTAGQIPPDNTIVIPVPPGQYILNILNLTNEPNIITFMQASLA